MVLIFAEALLKCMGTTRLEDKNSQCFIQSRWYLQTRGSKTHENCLEPLEQGLETTALGQAQPTARVAWPVRKGCLFLRVKKNPGRSTVS